MTHTLRTGALGALIAAALSLSGAAYAQTSAPDASAPPTTQSETAKPAPVKHKHKAHAHHKTHAKHAAAAAAAPAAKTN